MLNHQGLRFIALLFSLVTHTLYAQVPSWEALAKRIVNETVSVQAGEKVLITGGKHTMDLMEQVAAEVHRKGGHPIMIAESDVALKAMWHEKPMANLADYPSHELQLYKAIDYLIALPASQNFREIFQAVDPKRSAAVGSNSNRMLEELGRESRHSIVGISFPQKQEAEISGLDWATYEKIHWASINTNYTPIRAKGEELKGLLSGAKEVRITTPGGTDLTFSMGDRLVFADDGVLSSDEKNNKVMFARFASLPGGWMDFAPQENTVNGKIVVPQARCNYQPMLGVVLDVKNGVAQNFKAQQGGKCFEDEMAPHTGDKYTVSVFTIGLNPEVKVIQNEKTDFRQNIAAGYLTVTIGANNKQYNGSVVATGGYSFPLVNATLEIDGRVVIKNGVLQ